MTPNAPLRGILLMILAMAVFAVADTFVKLASQILPPPHTLMLLVGGTALVFCTMVAVQGISFRDSRVFSPVLLLRYLSEIVATFGMVLAFSFVPLSTVGAILQVSPLMVMLGAVFLLGERVSRAQWIAIAVGFAGVLLVVQPTAEGFDATILWAFVAMLGLAGRDLTTRRAPVDMPSSLMAAYTMMFATPFAVLWSVLAQGTVVPVNVPWLYVIGMISCGALAYLTLIASIRAAPVSVVTPFRYARLIFLLILGVTIFGERPNLWVLSGSALIVLSGIAALGVRRPHQ